MGRRPSESVLAGIAGHFSDLTMGFDTMARSGWRRRAMCFHKSMERVTGYRALAEKWGEAAPEGS